MKIKTKSNATHNSEEEAKFLSEEVEKVQEELAATLMKFENTTEPDLVEYYTYTYKATQIKHSYLLRKLKQLYYN